MSQRERNRWGLLMLALMIGIALTRSWWLYAALVLVAGLLVVVPLKDRWWED
jgi:hypothetical protein